ncbi:GNAT family N-acetyltransferase [Salirhabdus salicampi]|uniref:GNAT family N-acetyltransferase n=1 Tax=Salirhabdus salicampi TaxID=476102 RepID=UPI0020C375FA|nr:GNAT family N-acetyltransferase [Salirhabdus salicampi]MCP8615879.1 GNAT family N-acetyltransferase [Salirhabdus salicampi]
MIRKLNETDRDNCVSFISDEPAENLFIIGDLEAFGFDEDFQEVWGDFDANGKMRAILLRYRQNFIVYAQGQFDTKGIAQTIEQHPQQKKIISGISSVVNQIMPHVQMQPGKSREFFYAKCEQLQEVEKQYVQVRKGSIVDIPRILELHDQIPEFETREGRQESMTRNMKDGFSRVFYVEEDGEMVSSAMTTAENSMSAMVIGVCTLPGYKRKGYASACMIRLCNELLQEGKQLCLFYDNPEAGKIYKRLGFVDIGKWVMNEY